MYTHSVTIESLGDIGEQLDNEINKEYNDIANDASLINEIFKDLSTLTGQSDIPLYKALEHTEHIDEHVIKGRHELVKAAATKKTRNKKLLLCTTIGGGSVGTVVGGVLGSFLSIPGITVGAHIGLLIGSVIGGGMVGTGIGVISALSVHKL